MDRELHLSGEDLLELVQDLREVADYSRLLTQAYSAVTQLWRELADLEEAVCKLGAKERKIVDDFVALLQAERHALREDLGRI